jgi:DNA modification methylase
VFDEVWRVLRDDGTLWLNLGDSYSSMRDSKAVPDTLRTGVGTAVSGASNRNPEALRSAGLKHKDLVGIPWRVAFALQDRGWYLRSDIIWAKPNPMPESVQDRPTKAHEYLFLLTKQPRYFYDAEAIREADSGQDHKHRNVLEGQASLAPPGQTTHAGLRTVEGRNGAGRNARSVWTIPTQPYPEAHFATYPEELPRRCILAGCPKGGTVLDPFAGSCTTGAVAEQLGRDSVLIELSPEYARLGERRIQKALPLTQRHSTEDPAQFAMEFTK